MASPEAQTGFLLGSLSLSLHWSYGELVRGNGSRGSLGCPLLGMDSSFLKKHPSLVPLMEEHGWEPVHTVNNIRIVEDEGSSFRGAEVRGARGSLEPDKGARQGRQPHSRLGCPLVLQQRALSFVRGDSSRELPDLDQISGRIHQEYTSGVAGDNHAGPGRPAGWVVRELCPGTVEISHDPPVSTTHAYTLTHTLTASTEFFWPRIPPGKQAWGMGRGRWRLDSWSLRLSPAPFQEEYTGLL